MYHTVVSTAKFRRLVRALHSLVPAEILKSVAIETIAVGVLERVWHTTMSSAPCGNLGRLSDAEIADHCGWHLDPAKLIEALVGAGWLHADSRHRLVVHDWHDHAPRFCRGVAAKAGGFASEDADYMRGSIRPQLTDPNYQTPTEGNVTKRTEQVIPVPVRETSSWDARSAALPIAGDLFRRLDLPGPSALIWSVALAVARGAVPRTLVLDCADSTARNCTGDVEAYFRAAVGAECRARGILAKAAFPALPKSFGDVNRPGASPVAEADGVVIPIFEPQRIPDGPYDKKHARG